MKARIFLCIAVLLSALMVGCISSKDIIISPEELDKLESFGLEHYECQTNLSIVFYKNYRIDNKKNNDSFYLGKDGSLCFIEGKTPRGTWGKVRDKEVVAEKICELKELFQADMKIIDDQNDIKKMIADLDPLDSLFMKVILSEPLVHHDNHSFKSCDDMKIMIDSSSIVCYYYEEENLLSYISLDKKGNITDFYFSDFGITGAIDSLSLNPLFREYPDKEYYVWSVNTSSVFYINESRSLDYEFIYCLPPQDVKNLLWKVENMLMSVKMDLILFQSQK